jgi:hypothetical protein
MDEFSVDLMDVLISCDSDPFTLLERLNPTYDPSGGEDVPHSNNGHNTAPSWQMESISLAGYEGKLCEIRFSFDTTNGGYNGFRGWGIDDVSVEPQGPCVTEAPEFAVATPVVASVGVALLLTARAWHNNRK